MKIELKSDFDCLVEVLGQKYELIQDLSRIEIEVGEKESLIGVVYPINNRGLLSYAFKFNGNISNIKENIKVLKLGDDEFNVTLLPFYVTGKNFYKKKYKFNNMSFTLELSYLNTICCEFKTEEIYYHFNDKIDKYKFQQIGGVVFFLAKTYYNEILIMFDSNLKVFKRFDSQKFQVENSKIEFVCDQKSISQHGKKIVIKCDNGKIEIIEDLIYLQGGPKVIKRDELIPYAFFEAIKLKDYNLAKNFMTETLKVNISDEVLEKYFGEYDDIKTYNFKKDNESYICLCKENIAKIFRIKINKGFIEEIENFR